jgi:acyl-CoA dehydrogenase
MFVQGAEQPYSSRYVIAQSKILVPKKAAEIIDECMQLYGGQGLTQHTPLPELWTYARFVRIADGPDAAHRHQVGRDQLKTAETFRQRHIGYLKRARELAKQWGIEDQDERSWEYIPEAQVAPSSKL